MSYLLPFFTLFAACGLYLWLLGEALVSSSRTWSENALRAPWMGWAILLGALQLTHVFVPINGKVATALLLAVGWWPQPRWRFASSRDAPWLLAKREARI